MSVRLVLGARISAARRALNMTQADLATRVGVAPNQVSRWERGQSMAEPRHLRVLAEALQMDRDELYVLAIEAGAEDYAAVRKERDAIVDQLREMIPMLRTMLEREQNRDGVKNRG